jgi:hypothetical protein
VQGKQQKSAHNDHEAAEHKVDCQLAQKLQSQERRAQLALEAKQLTLKLENAKRKNNMEKLLAANKELKFNLFDFNVFDKNMSAQVEAAVAKEVIVCKTQNKNLRKLAKPVNAAASACTTSPYEWTVCLTTNSSRGEHLPAKYY